MPLENQIPPCQSASLAFSCPLDLLLIEQKDLQLLASENEGGRQAYLTPVCFLLPSLCSFPKEGT